MAILAIKGHTTRGKEVIELLEMLGGRSDKDVMYEGDGKDSLYYINKYKLINRDFDTNNYLVFTLEEFLKKFPYKIGDKVLYYQEEAIIIKLSWNGENIVYTIKCKDRLWDATTFNLKPYKQETMEETLMPKIDFSEYCKDKYLLDMGDYEIMIEDGKTYVVRKKPQYPRTCRECYKIFNRQPEDDGVYGYKGHLLEKFQELLICRNAYWKIAGEEMGFKPWEPDYKNPDIDLYVIINIYNQVEKAKYGYGFQHCLLTFPTEEMRDAFYQNFKDLIEECKELI